MQKTITRNITKFPRVKVHPGPGSAKRVLYHIAFWASYYLFYGVVVLYNMYGIRDPEFFYQMLSFLPFEILLVYLNIYILIPKILYERKIAQYCIFLMLAISVSIVINQLLKQAFAARGSIYYAATAGWSVTNFIANGIERIYLLGFTTGLKLAKDWIENIQVMREKEKHYLQTELNFLKSQIQPHFFFNTLNNLYSLTLKKSDAAPDVVLKLAELMSYMLYESNTAYVPLDKEIDYLQNYMDLEQLRFGDRMKVQIAIDGTTEDKRIPPLVLILFVENSFKHGVKNNLNEINIGINLLVKDNKLQFTISNPMIATHDAKTANGIGLKNVKRRLDLLYGDTYSLQLTTANDQFITHLSIPI